MPWGGGHKIGRHLTGLDGQNLDGSSAFVLGTDRHPIIDLIRLLIP